jgi:Pyridoxamine 5'-phosphate oxidase
MDASERRDFVRSHRVCVFGYGRKAHGPAMSLVYYVMDGDDILISTMAERGKAKTVMREPNVSICVLDEQGPPSYLLIYLQSPTGDRFRAGCGSAHADRRFDGWQAHAGVAPSGYSRKENRVMLRLTPYATFETPPRHVSELDDVKGLTHWLGTSLSWPE